MKYRVYIEIEPIERVVEANSIEEAESKALDKLPIEFSLVETTEEAE